MTNTEEPNQNLGFMEVASLFSSRSSILDFFLEGSFLGSEAIGSSLANFPKAYGSLRSAVCILQRSA